MEAAAGFAAHGEALVFLGCFADLPDPRQRGKVIYPLGGQGGRPKMRCCAWGPGLGCALGLARCCVRPLDGENLAAQTGITADATTTPVHTRRATAGAALRSCRPANA
jgi:hypothetical protein